MKIYNSPPPCYLIKITLEVHRFLHQIDNYHLILFVSSWLVVWYIKVMFNVSTNLFGFNLNIERLPEWNWRLSSGNKGMI